MNVTIFLRVTVPESLQQKWLQMMRDFDTANPGCHFDVGIEGPEEPFADMLKRLHVEPGLTFTKLYERAKWAPGDEP